MAAAVQLHAWHYLVPMAAPERWWPSCSESNWCSGCSPARVTMQVAVLHIAAYYLGYRLARATVAAENVPLARCISLESGMQSSLLGLLLASRFFHDPLVSLPCGISTIFMTLVSHSSEFASM